jgi:hypothetical protein
MLMILILIFLRTRNSRIKSTIKIRSMNRHFVAGPRMR